MQSNDVPSLSIALFDFLPVAFFILGAWYLALTAAQAGGERCRRLVVLGACLAILGGTLKALWKLLLAMDLGNVTILSEAHFALQAPGFLIMLMAVILMRRVQKRAPAPLGGMMAMAAWKMPLMIIMAFAGVTMQALLGSMALQRKSKLAAGGFVLSLACLLAMGAASGGEQTQSMQWVEEGINAIGQLGFATGSILLNRTVTLPQARLPSLAERHAAKRAEA
jgi:hypothetical protein